MSHDNYTTETDDPRKRYVCECGYRGSWQRDYGNFRRITADAAIAWNHKVHAGLMRKRKNSSIHTPTIDEHW